MRYLHFLSLCAAAVITAACTAEQNSEQSHAEMVSRTELERLENEIGKLEFRVFELENQALSEPAQHFPKDQAPAIKNLDGNFDLTPVE